MPFYKVYSDAGPFSLLANNTEELHEDCHIYGFKVHHLKRTCYVDRYSDQDRVSFYFKLGCLLSASLTVAQALTVMESDYTTKAMKTLCRTLKLQVTLGTGLNPKHCLDFFDTISSETLTQAQNNDTLITLLKTLEDFYEERKTTHAALQRMIQYPLLVGLMLLVFITVVTNHIMPHLLVLIPPAKQGWAFKSLQFFMNHFDIISVVFLCFVGAGIAMRRVIYHIPFIRRFYFVTFWQGIVFCIQNYLPFLTAFEKAYQALPPVYHPLFHQIHHAITHGMPIDQAFVTYMTGLDHSTTTLLNTLSKTAHIGLVLDKISQFETKFRKNIINNIISWTYPTLVFMMGMIVVWILCATFIPLYDSFSEF